MRFQVKVHKLAQLDIKDAAYWYNRKKHGLGKRFAESVNMTIQGLSEFPYFEIRYANYRCKQVIGFPYLIHFSIDEENRIVKIHGVKHTSRDPKETWKDET